MSEHGLEPLDRAARYYREALRHVIEECGHDKPRIDHIRLVAETGISAADHELEATPAAPPYAHLPGGYIEARNFLADAVEYVVEPDPEAAIRAAEEAIARIQAAM